MVLFDKQLQFGVKLRKASFFYYVLMMLFVFVFFIMWEGQVKMRGKFFEPMDFFKKRVHFYGF